MTAKLRIVSSRPVVAGSLSRALAERYEIDEAAPDVVLVERRDATDLAPLQAAHPAARILVLGDSDNPDPDDLLRVLQAGAHGYLRSTACLDMLSKVIDVMTLGEAVLPGLAAAQLIDRCGKPKPVAVSIGHPGRRGHAGFAGFSPSEASVLMLLTEGSSNKLIAIKLGIAEATVKVHVKAILRKLHVSNRTQAALWARVNHDQTQVGEA